MSHPGRGFGRLRGDGSDGSSQPRAAERCGRAPRGGRTGGEAAPLTSTAPAPMRGCMPDRRAPATGRPAPRCPARTACSAVSARCQL
eukprot:365338-Chlamydomonas_euryale.AAC.29